MLGWVVAVAGTRTGARDFVNQTLRGSGEERGPWSRREAETHDKQWFAPVRLKNPIGQLLARCDRPPDVRRD